MAASRTASRGPGVEPPSNIRLCHDDDGHRGQPHPGHHDHQHHYHQTKDKFMDGMEG